MSKLKCPQNFLKSIKILTEKNRAVLEKEAMKTDNSVSLGIILTMFTGIRIDKLCGLQWGDIDFISSVIAICRTAERITDLDPLAKAKTKVIISFSSIRLFSHVCGRGAGFDCYRA